MRRDGHGKDKTSHKLAAMADGPYKVVSLKDDTVLGRIEGELDRVSRDRIVNLLVTELIM